MKKAKHAKHRYSERTKKNSKKKFIILLLVFIIFSIFITFILPSINDDEKKPEIDSIPEETTIPQEEPKVELPEQFEIVDVSDLPESYGGYEVIGKIVIEKLGVTQKIFKDTINQTLKLGVTKFWGPDINEPGNLCLSGHNYKKVFGRLKELDIGDSFYIISRDGRKIDYTVTELLPTVDPYDMSHIEQNDDGIRKVTLITCEPRRTYKIFSESRTY